MSSLLKNLTSSALRNAPKRLREGQSTRLIGKVIAYEGDAVKVEALNGILAGQTIDITANKRSQVKVEDLDIAKRPKKPAQTSSFTEIGGYVSFDDVRVDPAADNRFTAYINAFIKEPDEDTVIRTDLANVTYEATNRSDRKDQPIHFLNAIVPGSETRPSSIEELEAVLIKALEAGHNANLIWASETEFTVHNFFKPKNNDQSVEDYVKLAFSGTSEEAVAETNASLARGEVTVVEIEAFKIGGKTAAENVERMEKGDRITTIDPQTFRTAALGPRLRSALGRRKAGELEIPEVVAERFKDAFLKDANVEAKEAFLKDGWRSVPDVDIRAFFKANGVELAKHPVTGWNPASIVLQKSNNTGSFVATKSQEQFAHASPYPVLECTKALREAYNVELRDAVLAVASPENKVEVKEAAKNAPADDAADMTAAAPDESLESVDNMLNEIGDDIAL